MDGVPAAGPLSTGRRCHSTASATTIASGRGGDVAALVEGTMEAWEYGSPVKQLLGSGVPPREVSRREPRRVDRHPLSLGSCGRTFVASSSARLRSGTLCALEAARPGGVPFPVGPL